MSRSRSLADQSSWARAAARWVSSFCTEAGTCCGCVTSVPGNQGMHRYSINKPDSERGREGDMGWGRERGERRKREREREREGEREREREKREKIRKRQGRGPVFI